jgi:hypothetical protein
VSPSARSAALAALALAALGLLALRSWTIDQPYSIDFQTYWLAGSRVLAGDAAALYDAGGGPEAGIPLVLPANEFKNLPVVSLVFAPFASLDYLEAKRVFWWVGLASLGLGAWLTPARRTEFAACLALFAVLDPAHVSLRHGQTTPLVLALLAGYLAAARAGKDVASGVLLGLACLVKFPPLALLAADAFGGRRRSAGAAALTIGAGIVLSGLVFGPELHAGYFRGVSEHAGTVVTGHNNQSILAVATRFLEPSPALDWTARPAPGAARALAFLGAMTMAGFLASALRRSGAALPGATYVAAMALGLVALPIAWDHYFLLLAPGVYLLAAEIGEKGLLGRRRYWAPLLLGTLAIGAPTPHALIVAADRLGRKAAPGLAVECAGALVLFAVAIATIRREPEARP